MSVFTSMNRSPNTRTRGLVALGVFGFGLLAIFIVWIVPRPRVDHTYDLIPQEGKWSFDSFRGRSTEDAVFLTFLRGWGHPLREEGAITRGAWKARMIALCSLAKMGDQTIPVLLRGLDDSNEEVRDLSAQAIGFFGDKSVVNRLHESIRQDPSATVRIYAAIALNTIAGSVPDELRRDILKFDPHPMVRARLELINPVQHDVPRPGSRETLATFDLSRIDTARVGGMAPDFALTDLDGRTYRLSDFRGKKNVALVFVYGVTCMFCTGQIRNLRANIEQFEATGTQVLIVEANEPYRVRSTANESTSEARLPILLDPTHTTAATYGIAMQMNHIEWLNRPSTFLIDRDGIIRTRFLSESATDRPPPSALLSELKKMQAPVVHPAQEHVSTLDLGRLKDVAE